MFRQMKLGTKIVAGFTLLVLIAVSLGGLAIYNMKNVETESVKLSEEYAPEVKYCNEVERNSLQTMYAVRGFSFTEDPAFYEEGKTNAAATQKALDDCRNLAENAEHLTGLKKAVPETQKVLDEYVALLEQTKTLSEKLNKNRGDLDTAAGNYMSNCKAFLAGQNEAFQKDLQERQQKITLVTDIVAIGTRTRVLNFKSQATGDSDLMDQAIQTLDTVFQKTRALRPITHEPEDIAMIDATEKAANGYKAAMQEYLVEFRKGAEAREDVLASCRDKMDANAAAYVSNCDKFLEGQQQALTKDMSERQAKITLVADIINTGQETRVACFKSQALRDPDIIRQANANFEKMGKLFAELRGITRLPEDIKRIDNTETAANNYKTAMNNLLDNWLAMREVDEKREVAGNAVLNQAQHAAKLGVDQTNEIANNAAASLSIASTTMIVGLSIAVVVSVVLALFITKSITGPIRRVIQGLTTGSQQTAAASGQVSSASQSLAEGASEAAASIEETSASIEEMASMTKQNASNSEEANSLAATARQAAERGTEAMGRMSNAINDIKGASDETAKIVKTIDEIAFQTNLLALNAAVEAARAGEAGKGFAVVAEEVRNLAQRSAEAAKNTADLIEGAVTKADNGVSISSEVANALEEIADGSRKVNDLVGEISAACNEQSRGIDQVSTAVTQLDQVTQSNAANAEESASASEELSAQAEELDHMVAELRAMVGGSESEQTNPGAKKGFRPAKQAQTRQPQSSPQANTSQQFQNDPQEQTQQQQSDDLSVF